MTPTRLRHGPAPGAVFGIAAAVLAGCAGGAPPSAEVGRSLAPEIVYTHRDGPPGAAPGTCWGQDVTPAHVETVTEHVMVEPAAPAADVTRPGAAVYRTETRQRIVREREEVWFRTPCADEMTPELVETLQRALTARGLYQGPVTGEMDAATRRAVRHFQRRQGLDSGLLSLTAARQLGIVAFDFGVPARR